MFCSKYNMGKCEKYKHRMATMLVWTVERTANSCLIFTHHKPRPSNIR
jgi:hypothetical protein